MSNLSNYEAVLALSTSPHMTNVMRQYIVELLAEHREMRDAMHEAIDFAEARQDVNDGDYGQPTPNDWMQIASILRNAVKGTR